VAPEDPELPFMFGQGWLVPEGWVVDDPEGWVVDGEAAAAPGVAAEEGEVDVAGALVVAAETAEVMPTLRPAAPPKMPRASRALLIGVRIRETDPLWSCGGLPEVDRQTFVVLQGIKWDCGLTRCRLCARSEVPKPGIRPRQRGPRGDSPPRSLAVGC